MNVRNVVWAVFAISILAGLDLVGAYLAKEFALRPRWLILASGVVAFSLLFIVYVRSLRLTELWIVTFGWVVLLEVGVLLLDRFRFSTSIPVYKLVLAGIIVTLQVFLLVPSRSPKSSGATSPTQPGIDTSLERRSPTHRPLPFAWAERPEAGERPVVTLGASTRTRA
jgi:hypothetical protein